MIFNREQLEARERATLAPYALLSRDHGGRIYEQAESAYRTAFQRDRDRILHSAAFRRLEYKTQVFTNDEGDYYRTRLTHTLEVAQIGRTLARALGANEDLVEAICLAHDLGHPPFGHSGEDTLNTLLADHGGFNHNAQSFRVVTELERRYPAFPGLNLTRETLRGIAGHETKGGDHLHLLDDDNGGQGSLEAQIANLTDELAYTAHDLDDGLNSEIIAPPHLADLAIWRLLCERLNWHGSALDEIMRHEFIRELVGVFVDDVLTQTSAALAAVDPQSVAAIKAQDRALVVYSAEIDGMRRALREFLYTNMYYSPRVVRMKQRAEYFIAAMFTALMDEPRQLPLTWQRELETRDQPRVIADYIASMTDRSALLEYRRLFDPMMRP